jgi:hypothetical protein
MPGKKVRPMGTQIAEKGPEEGQGGEEKWPP